MITETNNILQPCDRLHCGHGISKSSSWVLPFRRPVMSDVPRIYSILRYYRPSRTCDFTIGGIFMWANYFDYRLFCTGDTYFIRGKAEDETTKQAFSIPVGAMPLAEAVDLLWHHCQATGDNLLFSGVPAESVEVLDKIAKCRITPMQGWSDYVYDIHALSTLSGKQFNKKRNHVNRFMADNPGFSFLPINSSNLRETIEKFEQWSYNTPEQADALGEMEYYDHREAGLILATMGQYPMWQGAVLATRAHGIVAFTIGEVAGDTLVIHVEKMNHEVPGAGETINKLFAQMMLSRNPELLWVNREEDLGDPGLRQSKLSYHPSMLLPKYRVEILH